MNNSFKQYVTGQAFVMVLSEPMIDALRYIAVDHGKLSDAIPPNFPSMTALKRRGLVAGSPPRITKEGELTLELCRMAGLVRDAAYVGKAA